MLIISRHKLNYLLLIALTGFFLNSTGVLSYADDKCVECHKDEKFRVQNERLYEYFNDWKDSVHHLAGVSCSDCHGGSPGKSDKTAAHKGNFIAMSHMDRDTYKNVPGVCGKCHESVLNNFSESKHYKSLFDKGTGPHCVTCHGSMNAEVYYTSVIVRTCQNCHNEYTGNMPEIAGEADKVLHRINVSRAFKNWISLHYAEKEPEKAYKVNRLYDEVADSWHTFDFKQLDEKSMYLLNLSKSLVNKGLMEKRKSREKQ